MKTAGHNHHACDRAARNVGRKLKASAAAPAIAAGAAPVTTEVLASIGSTAIVPGILAKVPSTGYLPVPATSPYQQVSLTINLPLAIKLATGLTLALSVWKSTDGTDATEAEIASIAWTSYGPNGNPGNPKYGIPPNPDPVINVPLAPFLSNSAQLRYQTAGITLISGAQVVGNTEPVS